MDWTVTHLCRRQIRIDGFIKLFQSERFVFLTKFYTGLNFRADLDVRVSQVTGKTVLIFVPNKVDDFKGSWREFFDPKSGMS